jgi:hypothetical protein
VILLRDNTPGDFATEALIRGARGVVWITGDGRDDVRSQVQLADPAGDYLRKPTIPVFRVRPSVAHAMLEHAGSPLSELFVEDAGVTQSGPGWFARDMNASVGMSLDLSEPEHVDVPSVLGYKYGSDFDLSGDLVVLFASYDGLGTDPDGTIYPGANHSASGVGLLLEIARLWQEQDLDARRSVLFAAWGGGRLDRPGAREFMADSRNFPRLSTRAMYRSFAPFAIVHLDYLGAGGDTLWVDPESNEVLTRLLESSASGAGIPIDSEPELGDLQAYDDLVPSRRSAWLAFGWSNPGTPPDEDSIERVEPAKLQIIGEALSLALTKAVRQASLR